MLPTVRLPLAGLTVRDVSVGVAAPVTVTAQVALLPLAAAVMVVVPAATGVTMPRLLTVATAGLLLVQVTLPL